MASKKNSRLSRVIVGPSEPQKTGTSVAGKSRIHDCYGILNCGASIWRVLGVFPLTIEASTGSKKYVLNPFHAAYSCFIFVACVTNFTYIVSKWRRHDLNMVTVNLLLRRFSSLLCLFVAIIWRTFRHSELSKLIETIAAQEFVLQKMNCRLNYDSGAKIVRAYVWATTVAATFLMAYGRFVSKPIVSSEAIKSILWSMPLVIQTIDLTIFVTLVGLLGMQFRALNDRIEAVASRANASSPKVIGISEVCAENVLVIAKTHYNICAVGKRINAFFDWDVIINITAAFIILSTTLYYIFVEVLREGDTDYFRIGMYVQWEIIHTVPIIGLVMICNWTCDQGIQAGRLIHEIRVVETDSRLCEAVKSFSLQLHHQSLEFNACGFFPLNSTLLQTIVGNITTYLVLLIQFQPKLN